jgi:succinate dehydrogenase / fumarate reductase, membrane anchor subunit
MATPYTSSRTGSTQWLMQRVSAVLLIGLAFLHFGIQHFTSDAVTTGLTVAQRANNPFWQGYYVIFVVLALYHGVNGLVGIVRDHRPRPLLRGIIEMILWSGALYLAITGCRNFLNPTPVGAVKEFYAAQGFSAGSSVGHPPGLQGAISYDFRSELRELNLLSYYLEKHTKRSEETAIGEIFHYTPTGEGAPSDGEISASGASFDAWCIEQIKAGQVVTEKRDRSAIFSSSYEFAVWAAHVRQANSHARGEGDGVVEARFATAGIPIPAYRAVDLH